MLGQKTRWVETTNDIHEEDIKEEMNDDEFKRKNYLASGRCFRFIWNNPSKEDITYLISLEKKLGTEFKYMTFQIEKWKENGIIYAQGYIEFSVSVEPSRLKQIFYKADHLNNIMETQQQQAIEYCQNQDMKLSKDSEDWEKMGLYPDDAPFNYGYAGFLY